MSGFQELLIQQDVERILERAGIHQIGFDPECDYCGAHLIGQREYDEIMRLLTLGLKAEREANDA